MQANARRALMHLAVCVAAVSSCSFVLDGERWDDVLRCNTVADCPSYQDARATPACTHAEGFDGDALEVEKVCVPTFTPLPCEPSHYGRKSVLYRMYEAARSESAAYTTACDHAEGQQGCPPGDDGCAPGLVVDRKTGRCDDLDPRTAPALEPIGERAGHEVLDQFCRSYFCSVDFVCDNTRTRSCKPCVLGKDFGRGGCGELYFQGRRFSVYQTAEELEAGCQGADASPEGVQFGPVQTAG